MAAEGNGGCGPAGGIGGFGDGGKGGFGSSIALLSCRRDHRRLTVPQLPCCLPRPKLCRASY